MRKLLLSLKTAVLVALAAWSMSSIAQVNTMYVMKDGVVVFQSPVSGIDSLTFDKVAPDDALIIHKNETPFVDKILLNEIQQFSFSEDNFSIEASNGNQTYAFSEISKIRLGDMDGSGIRNPSLRSDFDVLVSFTPAGDVVVESVVAIKSLALFGIDGKMISKQRGNGVGTQYTVLLQGRVAGVYLLRVETEQGAVVKKVVKS